MAAIFGLIGEGSKEEVLQMGLLLAQRGGEIHTSRPAPRVHLGLRSTAPFASAALAIDAQLVESTASELAGQLEACGAAALSALVGYFSLAFSSGSGRQVLLACDTSGFKSLYYVVLGGRIAFASEYKAFLALDDFQPRLDRDGAQYYLATRSFRTGQPLMRGVCSLTPGSAVLISTEKLETHSISYWRPVRRIEDRSPADFARRVRETLMGAVERQSRSFKRVGVTLSGGFDSACVVALLRHVRPELHIASYTIGFGPEDTEIQGARELAELFGTEHREVIFDPECIPQTLPRLIWLMEDCGGREESLLQHLVLTQAGRSENVVFGGYGADALFGGMPRCRLIRMREAMPWLHVPLTEVYQLTQSGCAPRSLLGRLGKALLRGRESCSPPRVIGADGSVHVPDGLSLDELIAQQMCEAQDSGYLEATLEALDVKFGDPFQVTEMMDLALSIPGRYNVGFWRGKKVLRTAMRGLLPRAVLARKKSLQRIRRDLPLSRVLDAMSEVYLTKESIQRRGLVDPAYVRQLRNRSPRQAYSSEQVYALWTLLCVEIWMIGFLDARVAGVAQPCAVA